MGTSLNVIDVLRMNKAQYIDCGTTDQELVLAQTGAVMLEGRFELPSSGAVVDSRPIDEPIIDTFMVSTNDQSVTALGSDPDMIAHWMPYVEGLSKLVLDWLASAEVSPADHAYVTASITKADQVNAEPHFDDGLYDPAAGVGFVAVVGDGNGPKVATSPLPRHELPATTLLEVDEKQKASFHDGPICFMQAEANEVAAFPQFAQLHSGPGPIDGAAVRNLMVFRVETVPSSP